MLNSSLRLLWDWSCVSGCAWMGGVGVGLPAYLVVWKTRESILIFSTPGPYSALSVAVMRVFLPAPEGP